MSELQPCPVPTFRVIDHNTGKEADECEIALNELWASRLCYCDMEGWAIEQDGTLILMDECSQFAYPPKPERFEVVFDDNCAQPANEPLTLEQLREMHGKPVWVVPAKGVAKWYLVDVANDCCSTCDMDVVDFELYGSQDTSYGWLAYRRKPEGSENDG